MDENQFNLSAEDIAALNQAAGLVGGPPQQSTPQNSHQNFLGEFLQDTAQNIYKANIPVVSGLVGTPIEAAGKGFDFTEDVIDTVSKATVGGTINDVGIQATRSFGGDDLAKRVRNNAVNSGWSTAFNENLDFDALQGGLNAINLATTIAPVGAAFKSAGMFGAATVPFRAADSLVGLGAQAIIVPVNLATQGVGKVLSPLLEVSGIYNGLGRATAYTSNALSTLAYNPATKPLFNLSKEFSTIINAGGDDAAKALLSKNIQGSIKATAEQLPLFGTLTAISSVSPESGEIVNKILLGHAVNGIFSTAGEVMAPGFVGGLREVGKKVLNERINPLDVKGLNNLVTGTAFSGLSALSGQEITPQALLDNYLIYTFGGEGRSERLARAEGKVVEGAGNIQQSKLQEITAKLRELDPKAAQEALEDVQIAANRANEFSQNLQKDPSFLNRFTVDGKTLSKLDDTKLNAYLKGFEITKEGKIDETPLVNEIAKQENFKEFQTYASKGDEGLVQYLQDKGLPVTTGALATVRAIKDTFDGKAIDFNTITKELPATQSTGIPGIPLEQVKNLNKKYFGDENVRIVENILTPDGQAAIGQYSKGWIDLVEGKGLQDTFHHEAVHKALDLFADPIQRKKILDQIINKYGEEVLEKKYKLSDKYTNAEERLAEDFVDYTSTRTGVRGTVKTFFEKLINNIKSFLGNKDEILSFYNQLSSGDLGTIPAAEPAGVTMFKRALPDEDASSTEVGKALSQDVRSNVAKETAVQKEVEDASFQEAKKDPAVEEVIKNIAQNENTDKPVDTTIESNITKEDVIDESVGNAEENLMAQESLKVAIAPESLMETGLNLDTFKETKLFKRSTEEGGLDAFTRVSNIFQYAKDNGLSLKPVSDFLAGELTLSPDERIKTIDDLALKYGGVTIGNKFTTIDSFANSMKTGILNYEASYMGSKLKSLWRSLSSSWWASTSEADRTDWIWKKSTDPDMDGKAAAPVEVFNEIMNKDREWLKVENAIKAGSYQTPEEIASGAPPTKYYDDYKVREEKEGRDYGGKSNVDAKSTYMSNILGVDNPNGESGWANRAVRRYQELVDSKAPKKEIFNYITQAVNSVLNINTAIKEAVGDIESKQIKEDLWMVPTVEVQDRIQKLAQETYGRTKAKVFDKDGHVNPNKELVAEGLGDIENFMRDLSSTLKLAPNEANVNGPELEAKWKDLEDFTLNTYQPLHRQYYSGYRSVQGLDTAIPSHPIYGDIYFPKIGKAPTNKRDDAYRVAQGDPFIDQTSGLQGSFHLGEEKGTVDRLKKATGDVSFTEKYNDSVNNLIESMAASFRMSLVDVPLYNMAVDIANISGKIKREGGRNEHSFDGSAIDSVHAVYRQYLKNKSTPPSQFEKLTSYVIGTVQRGITRSIIAPLVAGQFQSWVPMVRLSGLSDLNATARDKLNYALTGIFRTIKNEDWTSGKVKVEDMNALQQALYKSLITRISNGKEQKIIRADTFKRTVDNYKAEGKLSKDIKLSLPKNLLRKTYAVLDRVGGEAISATNDRITRAAYSEIYKILKDFERGGKNFTPDELNVLINTYATFINGEFSKSLAADKKGLGSLASGNIYISTLLNTQGIANRSFLPQLLTFVKDGVVKQSKELDKKIIEANLDGIKLNVRYGRDSTASKKTALNLAYLAVSLTAVTYLYQLAQGLVFGKINPFSDEAKKDPAGYFWKSATPSIKALTGNLTGIPFQIFENPASGFSTVAEVLGSFGKILNVKTNGLEKTTSEATANLMKLVGLGYVYRATEMGSTALKNKQDANIDLQDLFYSSDYGKVAKTSSGSPDPLSMLFFGLSGVSNAPAKPKTDNSIISALMGNPTAKAGINQQGVTVRAPRATTKAPKVTLRSQTKKSPFKKRKIKKLKLTSLLKTKKRRKKVNKKVVL